MTPTYPHNYIPQQFRPIRAEEDRNDDNIKENDDIQPALIRKVSGYYFKERKENGN